MNPVADAMRAAMAEALDLSHQSLTWRDKGGRDRVDLVTEGDLLVDGRIGDALDALHPGVPLVSEERPWPEGAGEGDCFVLDPIDGTHNFAAGMPWWGISLARVSGSEVQEAWLLEAPAGRLYHASRGGPATCEGEVIEVTARPPRLTLASVGLSSRVVPLLVHSEGFSGVRVLGSHAVSLAWAAAGRFALHAGRGYVWDVAAGYLLIERAGGRICRFDGRPRALWDHDYALAGAPQAVDAALETLASGGMTSPPI